MGGADPNGQEEDVMGYEVYIKPAIKGGIVAMVGGSVGAFAASLPVLGPVVGGFAGIVGGALTLILVEMSYK